VIPVHYLRLGSMDHILEVFTRLNRAGVQVTGEDLFFAAVKTRWSEAEQSIRRVVDRLESPDGDGAQAPPLVDRLSVFRAVARIAARAVRQSDIASSGRRARFHVSAAARTL
jgi:hypothetical protein